MATKSTQQGNGITPRMVRVAGLPPGSFPGRCCSVGRGCRSDVSVDLAGRTARTPSGRPLLVTATATATSLDCTPADSPAAPTTTASATTSMPADGPGSRSRPGKPTHLSCGLRSSPAVAYDGDLDVSRRIPAPGLVRRADAAPCVLLVTALTTLMSPKEPQFPADSGGNTHVAKLHFAEQVTQTMLTVTALSVEPSLN